MSDRRHGGSGIAAGSAEQPVSDRSGVGIVMSRVGCNPDEAFDRLRHISQHQNRKLHTVAQHMVDEAVRTARARHLRP
jgi:hypothetical protein